MSPNWSRRALLASLGASALAGCVGERDTPRQSPTRTATPTDSTPTQTPTETPRADPDPPTSIASEWPMPAHDAGRSSFAPGAAGPTEPVAELWRVDVDTGLSAPVLADETLFVGRDDGVVLALDARTGDERWQQTVGDRADAPRVVDGTVFVPTRSAIVALDAAEGAERWRTAVPERTNPDRADVLAATHGVYWLVDDVVAALDRDGSERWRATLEDPWEFHLFASDAVVYVSTGTHGRIPWRFAVDSGDLVGDEPQRGYDFAAERFYLDGAFYAVDPFFGAIKTTTVSPDTDGWNRGVDAAGSRYAISGGADRVFYVANAGSDPGTYALARSDGTIDWTSGEATKPFGRPVVATETVLVRTDDALHCFDPKDGSLRWTRADVGMRLAVADDLLYTTGTRGIRAFRAP